MTVSRTLVIIAVAACAVGVVSAQGALSDAASLADQDTLSVQVEARIVVADQAEASNQLASWADENGGYFVERSFQRVVVRVPTPRVDDYRALIYGVGDPVLAYNPSAQDLRDEISTLRAEIISNDQALEQILEYVDESNVAATLALEQELRAVLTELERLAGRLRALQNDIAFSRIRVDLSAQQETIPRKRPSSFQWINTMDLYRFIREAQP
jgi:hypothetical protein